MRKKPTAVLLDMHMQRHVYNQPLLLMLKLLEMRSLSTLILYLVEQNYDYVLFKSSRFLIVENNLLSC